MPVIAAACTGIGEPLPDGSSCDVRDLSAVFHEPAAFHGKIFCGTAYSDFQSGMYSLYPAWPQAEDDAYDTALLLTGLSRRQEQQLDKLPAGSALRIVGILDSSESCTRPPPPGRVEQCAPIKHPIYIEKVRISPE